MPAEHGGWSLTLEPVLLGLLVARFWWPLLAAAPLVAIKLWFDMRSRSRRLLPELAGTVGIGSVAAETALALGLWVAVAARAGAVRAAPRPAKIIGLQQMFFGIAVGIVTAIAVLA